MQARSLCRTLPLALAIGVILAACDDQPTRRSQARLSPPKGESSLDALLQHATPAEPAIGHLTLDPSSLSFTPVPVGHRTSQTLQIRNDGGAPMVLRSLRLAGGDEGLHFSGDCRSGSTLAPGAACGLEIGFAPARRGQWRADLVVDQGAAAAPLFLPISADCWEESPVEAAAPAAPHARAALSYASLRQAAPLNVAASDVSASGPPRDLDYREAGLPGVVSGFPVDRSRVITADRVITAILETSLDSQLPGRAIAVVDRPIFGEEGRLVLIPAGARIIGHYRSGAKYGLARLDISWSRILRPDGAVINLEADSADPMGRAGVPGDLDTRGLEKYGSSFLVSVIGAAAEWGLASSSTAVTSPLGGTTQVQNGRTLAANRLGNDSDRLAQRMVEDNVDIRPILTVPAGTRLLIIPTEDIWLRDPAHLRPVSKPRNSRDPGKGLPTSALIEMLPGLIDLLAQNPTVQKLAPLTAEQIMQSSLLQRLRENAGAAPTTEDKPAATDKASATTELTP